MKLSLLAMTVGLVISLSQWSSLAIAVSEPVEQLPNVIVILADDLGYGDIGCYNPESKIPTPNLDRLAKQGMRFTDAHSPCTVCTPTRYSLMTGQRRPSVFWGRWTFFNRARAIHVARDVARQGLLDGLFW